MGGGTERLPAPTKGSPLAWHHRAPGAKRAPGVNWREKASPMPGRHPASCPPDVSVQQCLHRGSLCSNPSPGFHKAARRRRPQPARGDRLRPLEPSGSREGGSSRRICLFRLGAASHTHLGDSEKLLMAWPQPKLTPSRPWGSGGGVHQYFSLPGVPSATRTQTLWMEGKVGGRGGNTQSPDPGSPPHVNYPGPPARPS